MKTKIIFFFALLIGFSSELLARGPGIVTCYRDRYMSHEQFRRGPKLFQEIKVNISKRRKKKYGIKKIFFTNWEKKRHYRLSKVSPVGIKNVSKVRTCLVIHFKNEEGFQKYLGRIKNQELGPMKFSFQVSGQDLLYFVEDCRKTQQRHMFYNPLDKIALRPTFYINTHLYQIRQGILPGAKQTLIGEISLMAQKILPTHRQEQLDNRYSHPESYFKNRAELERGSFMTILYRVHDSIKKK